MGTLSRRWMLCSPCKPWGSTRKTGCGRFRISPSPPHSEKPRKSMVCGAFSFRVVLLNCTTRDPLQPSGTQRQPQSASSTHPPSIPITVGAPILPILQGNSLRYFTGRLTIWAPRQAGQSRCLVTERRIFNKALAYKALLWLTFSVAVVEYAS